MSVNIELYERVCTKCKILKSDLEFFRGKGIRGRKSQCKNCEKDYKLKNGYHSGKMTFLKEQKEKGLYKCRRCSNWFEKKDVWGINSNCLCKSCSTKQRKIRMSKPGYYEWKNDYNLKRKYGFWNKEIKEIVDLQRNIKNTSVYRYDDKTFKTRSKLAEYVSNTFNISKVAIFQRITRNVPQEDWILPVKEFKIKYHPKNINK